MLTAAASVLPGPVARLVAGNSLAAKQDRAANAVAIAELVNLRPERAGRLAVEDFVRVGELHGIEPWKLHALADIESRKGGFDNDGRAIIAPELHQFSRLTAKAYDQSHPELSIPKWIPPAKVRAGHPYTLNNFDRWDLLARQAHLNFDAAIQASSWGAFQVMGFNYKKLGFASAIELVRHCYKGERAQLDIAVRYLIADGGFEPLLKNDFVGAAHVQNGPGQPKSYAAKWKQAADARRTLYA